VQTLSLCCLRIERFWIGKEDAGQLAPSRREFLNGAHKRIFVVIQQFPPTARDQEQYGCWEVAWIYEWFLLSGV
jgi:hypothetical protein